LAAASGGGGGGDDEEDDEEEEEEEDEEEEEEEEGEEEELLVEVFTPNSGLRMFSTENGNDVLDVADVNRCRCERNPILVFGNISKTEASLGLGPSTCVIRSLKLFGNKR